MASTIQIKRGTGSAVPSGLADGELAINLDSGKLYFGSGSTSVDNFTFGELTAEKYIVSSSVLYVTTSFSSGSTEFGDTADDTHTFTGHITASGNISASGTIIGGALQISSTDTSEDATHYVTFQKPGNNLTNITNGLTFNPSTDKLTLGGGTTFIEGSTGNINAGGRIHTTNITASGNISASGTIISHNLEVSNNITAVSASIPGVIVGNPNLLSLGDPDGNVGAVRAEINQNGTTQFLGNATLNLKGTTINIDSDSGGTAKINLLGNVTASGNISSSGKIYADEYYSEGVLGLRYIQGATHIGDGNNIKLSGIVTASGNISSSGTIVGSNLSGTNTGDQNISNLAVTSSNVLFGDITASGEVTFGGGYGDTGATISTAGVGQFNGALTTDSSLTCTGTVLINGNSTTTGARILFREGTDNGVNAIGFQSPAAVTTTTTFILPDGDGSNGQVLATNGSAVLSWATAGGDPSGAQTGITTIFNTGTKIGYADNGANIDFTTDNNIIFDIDGTQQIQLADGVLKPVTDSDVDLGTDALRFKDAYVDSVTSAGIVTAKTYDYISCGFFDNLSTTLHYLPLNGKPTEQTSEGNSYTDWVAPCHTTVLSIQVRFSSIIGSGGDITMTVWKDPVGSGTKASVEAETVSVGGSNDNDVIHFLFDGAVIDKGETMKISIQSTGGMTSANTFVTVVLLQDWNDRYTASSQVFTS